MNAILSHIFFYTSHDKKHTNEPILESMHIPVLLNESITALTIKKDGVYVDCTTNRGGHSEAIAKHLSDKGTLICIDLDEVALREAKEKLSLIKNGPKIHFIQSNFRHIVSIINDLGYTHVDGILADLGISSQELDSSGRGFTFRYDEPLVMTFASKPGEDMTTAYDIVNFWNETTIADVLYGFADEEYSRRIAKNIVEARSVKAISSTFELVDIIARSVPVAYRHRKTHFATKTFQALRMATNDELGCINDLIEALPDILSSNGRAAIITFHSTEDRIVKQGLRSKSEKLKLISRKAIIPTDEEQKINPRSRSAQLRIVERI